MSVLNIFLDDGGVITDKQRRATEFERLVGDYFVALLGRTEASWTRAHRVVVDQPADPLSMSVLAAADFVGFYRAYQLRWIAGMCQLLDLPIPPEEECLDLAYRALGWITCRIQAALPGAVEAIRLLHRQGYALHTASGSCSLELAGALEGMGVRHCFCRLYGADLINTFKAGPQYYAHLFADALVQPEETLVVRLSVIVTSDWVGSSKRQRLNEAKLREMFVTEARERKRKCMGRIIVQSDGRAGDAADFFLVRVSLPSKERTGSQHLYENETRI